MFIGLLSSCTIVTFGQSLASNSKGAIKFLPLNIQPCKARPRLVNINSNQTIFYPFADIDNSCGEGCNTVDNAYVWVCVPNKVKNMM